MDEYKITLFQNFKTEEEAYKYAEELKRDQGSLGFLVERK